MNIDENNTNALRFLILFIAFVSSIFLRACLAESRSEWGWVSWLSCLTYSRRISSYLNSIYLDMPITVETYLGSLWTGSNRRESKLRTCCSRRSGITQVITHWYMSLYIASYKTVHISIIYGIFYNNIDQI